MKLGSCQACLFSAQAPSVYLSSAGNTSEVVKPSSTYRTEREHELLYGKKGKDMKWPRSAKKCSAVCAVTNETIRDESIQHIRIRIKWNGTQAAITSSCVIRRRGNQVIIEELVHSSHHALCVLFLCTARDSTDVLWMVKHAETAISVTCSLVSRSVTAFYVNLRKTDGC